MRYYLFVGFSAEIYKRPPRVRCFVNGDFVDEFYVKCSSGSDNDEQSASVNYLEPISISAEPDLSYIDKVAQMNIYEIEIKKRYDKDIRIELYVKNNDNNYNNGFMTKWTRLRLQYLNLVPSQAFNHIERWHQWPWRKASKIYDNNPQLIKKHFKNRPSMFNNLVNYTNFVSKNGKIQQSKNYNIGESGCYVCDGITRFNLINATGKKHIGYYRAEARGLEKIYHKYLHNENQRSSN